MSKINYEILDRDVYNQYRNMPAAGLAKAYVTEAFGQERENHLNTLHEMGQAVFSERLNNRQAREALFMQFVNNYAATILEKAN